MASIFCRRHHLSRWAARVLFFWLFALGTGMANACLASDDTPADAAHGSNRAALVAAHPDEATHDQASTADGMAPSHGAGADGHHGNLDKANCQDFCGKAKGSIPCLKSALDELMTHAAINSAAMAALPLPAVPLAQSWVSRRDDVPRRPVRIAFLRLVL